MNELFVLLETVRGIGWVMLGITLVLAATLAIFDRRKTASVKHELEAAPEHKAA